MRGPGVGSGDPAFRVRLTLLAPEAVGRERSLWLSGSEPWTRLEDEGEWTSPAALMDSLRLMELGYLLWLAEGALGSVYRGYVRLDRRDEGPMAGEFIEAVRARVAAIGLGS